MLFTPNYLKDLPIYESVKPYQLHGFTELNKEQETNCVFEDFTDVVVEGLRDTRDDCRVEKEGFEFMRAPTRCALNPQVFEKDAADASGIIQDYLQKTIEIVRERFNACGVIAMDWRVLRSCMVVSRSY